MPLTVHLPHAGVRRGCVNHPLVVIFIPTVACGVALWARVFLGGFVLGGLEPGHAGDRACGLSLAATGSLAPGVTPRSLSCFSQQKES